MKKNIFIIVAFVWSFFTYAQVSSDKNYIYTTSYKVPVSDGNQSGIAETDKIQEITYYDGVGRPIQSIMPNVGGNQEDLITHFEYDSFGRQTKNYLPYVTNLTNNLGYVTNAQQNILTYYGSKFSEDFQNGVNPYSETVFESSPKNRLIEQGGPGSDWKVKNDNTGHTNKISHLFNEVDDVINFEVEYPNDDFLQPNIVFKGFYGVNELYVTVVKNENWQSSDGKLNTSETYSDKSGKKILTRSFEFSNNEVKTLNTYYVYDYFGNLVYVISPKAADTFVIQQMTTNNYSQNITYGELLNNTSVFLSGSTAANLSQDSYGNITLSLNFTVGTGQTLKTGNIANLLTTYPNVVFGNITDGVYNYEISIVDNALVITNVNNVEIPGKTRINTSFLFTLKAEYSMEPIDNEVLKELCYQYKYDHKNRLVEKKVPGKDWEYVVYDKLNRPVLTQNAINRDTNEWLFVKYDKFNRSVYTGEHTNTASRAFIQQYIDNQSNPVLFEQQNSSFINSGAVVNYTNDAFPDTDIEVNSIMYYDNYNFSLAGITVPTVSTPAYSTAITTVTKGLVTGSKIKTLETNNWTTTAIVYDEKARPVWVKSVNDYLGTTDEVETKLDFIGQALENKTIHNKIPVVTNLTTFDYFTYDHAGRLLKHTQKIGAADEELISFNQYDDLGQLVQQKVGGTPASTYTAAQGLQTIDYSFNVRGWLKGINDTGSLGNDLFAYAIKYNAPTAGTALYNGNISQTFWKTANDNELRGYTYTYDKLDRLTEAQFTNANNTAQNNSYTLKNVTYDANGNITFLHRSGDVISNANQESMDYMYYHYEGNKLVRVEEQGHGSIGFATPVSASDTSVQYSYDDNGNVQSDNNKEISDINYNYFNQPLHIAFNDPSKYIDFVYNAGGVKLSKTVTVGSNTTTTYYAGNYIYEETSNTTVLQCIAQPQGYVTVNGGDYNYVYQYKDHVGNIRLSYTQDSNGQLQIVEENNYFPFGMKHTGYNNVVSSLGNSVANGFDFLGKENLEIGGVDLKLTEMDFRKYDVALGRFNGIDLLAEDGQFSITPYHYAGNNPVLFSDPSGLKKQDPRLKLEEPMWQPEGGYFQLYNMGGNFYNNLTNGSNLGGGVPGASGAMGGYGYGTLYSTDFFDNGREQAAWSDAVTKLVNSVNFVDNGFDPEFEQNLPGIIVTDENKALLNIIDLINDAGYHYYGTLELNNTVGVGVFNIDAAVNTMNSNAYKTYSLVPKKDKGSCARFVRYGIESGFGMKKDNLTRLNPRSPVAARDWGVFLVGLGFTELNTTNYKKGDVVVMQGYPGGTSDRNGIPYGHIAMYNGSQWISYWYQNSIYAGSGYRKNNSPYKIYRWNN